MKKILLLIIACFIWGLGFAATRWTLDSFDPYWSNTLRFTFAAVLSFPFLLWRKRLNFSLGVFVCSFCLLTALQLQTIGIGLTTLAKSGFLTAFYAIFTPLIQVIFSSKTFSWKYWILVLLALFGIALLCDLSWSGFNVGDAWILASALFFSLHILAIDKYGQKVNSLDFNFQQIIVIGFLALALTLVFRPIPEFAPLLDFSRALSPSPLAGFLVLSIFSSMLAFSIQVYAQKGTPAHIVSLIFLSESVFSAIFGLIFFEEHLNFKGTLGAMLVMLSVSLIPASLKIKKASHERGLK